MEMVSVSQFKINPAAVLAQANVYPVPVTTHNQVSAYVVGKELYEQLMSQLEDHYDRAAIADTDFKKGKDLADIMRELAL